MRDPDDQRPTDAHAAGGGDDDVPTDGDAFAAIDDHLSPGSDVGGYIIETELGSGAMGVVYSATHPVIGKRAAIKVLKPELSKTPAAVERFIMEARAVNQIGHPNIVDIFAFGKLPDGRSYYVMDLLSGESLRKRVKRGPLHVSEAVSVIDEVASALMAAHDKGIVHRDLKPDNIFMVSIPGRWPESKLLDWGLLKLTSTQSAVSSGKYRTLAGSMMGTPVYMSPEQARASDQVDSRTDIYALGVMAYELLAGVVPFKKGSSIDTILAHQDEPVPSLQQKCPALPVELVQLIEAMLAKEPDDRPTLAAVRAVIKRLRGTQIPTMTAAGLSMPALQTGPSHLDKPAFAPFVDLPTTRQPQRPGGEPSPTRRPYIELNASEEHAPSQPATRRAPSRPPLEEPKTLESPTKRPSRPPFEEPRTVPTQRPSRPSFEEPTTTPTQRPSRPAFDEPNTMLDPPTKRPSRPPFEEPKTLESSTKRPSRPPFEEPKTLESSTKRPSRPPFEEPKTMPQRPSRPAFDDSNTTLDPPTKRPSRPPFEEPKTIPAQRSSRPSLEEPRTTPTQRPSRPAFAEPNTTLDPPTKRPSRPPFEEPKTTPAQRPSRPPSEEPRKPSRPHFGESPTVVAPASYDPKAAFAEPPTTVAPTSYDPKAAFIERPTAIQPATFDPKRATYDADNQPTMGEGSTNRPSEGVTTPRMPAPDPGSFPLPAPPTTHRQMEAQPGSPSQSPPYPNLQVSSPQTTLAGHSMPMHGARPQAYTAPISGSNPPSYATPIPGSNAPTYASPIHSSPPTYSSQIHGSLPPAYNTPAPMYPSPIPGSVPPEYGSHLRHLQPRTSQTSIATRSSGRRRLLVIVIAAVVASTIGITIALLM